MAIKRGQNPNHPRKGSSIKVDPIRNMLHINAIKRDLITRGKMRDYCLFTLGLNTALRANELLSLRVSDVRDLRENDVLDIKQSKSNEYRIVTLNRIAVRSIEFWLEVYEPAKENAVLFPSRQGRGSITVPSFCNLVKQWCSRVNAMGNFGSHTLRKSWGYHQRLTYEAPLSLLVKAFGHSSERQTLDYLGIQPREISALFRNEI